MAPAYRYRSAAAALLPMMVACAQHSTPPPSPAPIIATTTESPVAAPAPAPAARTENWVNLDIGDCLGDLPPGDFSQVMVTVVDCASSHVAEVYARVPVAVNTAITDVANQKCTAGFAEYTGRPLDGSGFSMTYLIDSNQDRTANNPLPSTVICLLQSGDGGVLTGTARG